jgi:hypothetical protein
MANTNKAGLLSNVLQWISYPSKSSITLKEWAAFLAVAIIVAFLWSTVVGAISKGISA